MMAFAAVLALLGAPAQAEKAGPWSPDELKSFMKELADYVFEHHVRRDASPMRGKVYEFFMPSTKQQGYGGGWDTMHDGAWFANACLLAYRATEDRHYLGLVKDWILPFYLGMLNRSDTLFPDRQGAYSDGQFLPPERAAAGKGFVPYWWDDGHGVNFDALARKMTTAQLLNPWGFTSTLPDPSATDGRLSGYSHGTSNHLALALFPMLANAWFLTRDPEVAEAIRNLRESRLRQVNMDLPFLAIADEMARGEEGKASKRAGGYDQAPWPPPTPLYAAMVDRRKVQLPPFIDDPEAAYFASVAGRRVGAGTAKRLAQMTHDCLVLADLWYGGKRRPRGLAYAADSRARVWIEGGQFSSLAGEVPDVLVGSRMGPQGIWACAQGLQLLRAFPDAWTACYRERRKGPVEGWSEPPLEEVRARFQEELDEGLRFWRNEMRTVGYIRPDWPIGGKRPAHYWSDRTSETGGYAHLISACAEYLVLLYGRADWELAWKVRAP